MGCKVNLSDAASLVDLLPASKFELVDSPDEADLVVLNTCTVTHKADRDSRKFLGSLARRFPDLQVIVTGCGAVTNKEKFSEYSNVKAVFLPSNEKGISDLLGAQEKDPGSKYSESPFVRMGRKRAFVKVQDGCNARCTYCTIPQVRGPQRSMQTEEVRLQVKRLLDTGHRELVFTGIHLGRYGTDLHRKSSLSELLNHVAPEFEHYHARLRLSSIEPREWTDELLDTISGHDLICRHFHVPLQSGHDEILSRMGRPYTAEQYLASIEKLRKSFPNSAIGADVLVGFPGETDEMADTTAAFVEKASLDYLHVFTFSSRPGTLAASMNPKVSDKRIKERAARLRQIGQGSWDDFTHSGIGKFHMLLGEKLINDGVEGRSEHYRKLRLAKTNIVGKLIKVKALSLDGDRLICDLVQERRD